ncbi:hypothetical protein RhiirC2_761573 [Rhizophagus irregularis]|uniref:Uncharacterized protein n=1 Tax=Rhizophagus irregularis TaxID=588596 RepID=A0A2N1MG89_9GLOM|nr:hypothetical protein RhiirC2_761573 [Rhizophagus irregularis]
MNPDKEIKPSEYFKHLLVYKDSRFARHRRWRYFALNSLMRRRASSEAKYYGMMKDCVVLFNIGCVVEP